MINLLSDERKGEIQAARANVILSRYIAIIVAAAAFLGLVLYVSYTILENTKTNNEVIIQNNTEKTASYNDTRSEIDTLSSKLAQTKSTLDQEIRYSTVLTTIGSLMPADTILDSLNLGEASFSGAPVDLKAYAKTNDGATAIRNNLQTSPLFLSVTLNGTDSSNGTDGYPISADFTVVFNKSGAH